MEEASTLTEIGWHTIGTHFEISLTGEPTTTGFHGTRFTDGELQGHDTSAQARLLGGEGHEVAFEALFRPRVEERGVVAGDGFQKAVHHGDISAQMAPFRRHFPAGHTPTFKLGQFEMQTVAAQRAERAQDLRFSDPVVGESGGRESGGDTSFKLHGDDLVVDDIVLPEVDTSAVWTGFQGL